MKPTPTNNVSGLSRPKAIAAAGAAAIVVSVIGFFGGQLFSEDRRSPEVFSTAHVSVGEAAQHFFGIRPDPIQPIAFVHKAHAEAAELQCTDCHLTVGRGPRAGIPDIRTCWSCHQQVLPDHPEIRKIRAYRDRGEDIPWQRVYGWTDEAHVRFNHAPHIRAQVECSTCHGDVARMAVAERVVTHTMGFCVSCHDQRKVSNDCQTCHY